MGVTCNYRVTCGSTTNDVMTTVPKAIDRTQAGTSGAVVVAGWPDKTD